MKEKNLPFKLYWKKQFTSALKGKTLSITELSRKLDVRPETISRWVNYFEAEKFVKTKFDGLKRMVSINEKKIKNK
ncbi:MAG: helix-turn-helix domain-containing protein [Nanoarchaeota archaeon]|nr:helix-turn-helix domain-containing protein [Nanoarchaeota archaeon]MCG2717675.1 helix-turn-helix domain-containing protein [Nanoarchaeota archaeon]